jgi:hypothetical protein
VAVVLLKFRMNGEGWLDPSTVRMMLDVVNGDNVEKP